MDDILSSGAQFRGLEVHSVIIGQTEELPIPGDHLQQPELPAYCSHGSVFPKKPGYPGLEFPDFLLSPAAAWASNHLIFSLASAFPFTVPLA